MQWGWTAWYRQCTPSWWRTLYGSVGKPAEQSQVTTTWVPGKWVVWGRSGVSTGYRQCDWCQGVWNWAHKWFAVPSQEHFPTSVQKGEKPRRRVAIPSLQVLCRRHARAFEVRNMEVNLDCQPKKDLFRSLIWWNFEIGCRATPNPEGCRAILKPEQSRSQTRSKAWRVKVVPWATNVHETKEECKILWTLLSVRMTRTNRDVRTLSHVFIRMENPWTSVESPLVSGPKSVVKIASTALLCTSLHINICPCWQIT